MKKTIIILAALALIASSCKPKATKQNQTAETDNAVSDSVRVIDETCLIFIPDFKYEKAKRERIAAGDDSEETGDAAFYRGNAIGQFSKLGIESVIDVEEKDRYLSFALDKGERYVVDLKTAKPADGLLYKKGKKPIDIGIGWENPVGFALEEVATCLGMKTSEVMKQVEITSGMFRDSRDNKPYSLVMIGTQIWTAENIAYEAKGSVCYDHDVIKCLRYGRLYDWETAKKACPPGWHLPTDDEWTTLISYVDVSGDKEAIAKKLKTTSGWDEWLGEDGNGTNDYGFSALPASFGNIDGSFGDSFGDNGPGKYAMWWSATEYDSENAWDRWMFQKPIDAYDRSYSDKRYLLSVRCVKDE